MKLSRLVLLAATLCAAVLGAHPAGAQTSSGSCSTAGTQYPPQDCTVVANDTEVRPGEPITLSGRCPAGATSVSFRLVPGDTDLGTAQPAADGSYTKQVTIPSGTGPGSYEIQARCEGVLGNGVVRSVAITVVAAAAQQSATLPRTGSDVTMPLTAAGIGLIALGGLAVVAVRRRRAAA